MGVLPAFTGSGAYIEDDLAKIKQKIRDLVTATLDSTNFWEAFDNLINGLGELTGDDFFDDGVEEVTA
jgi:hypothetical protein